MIYEYAVDPDLLPHWSKPKQFRFWRNSLGLGQARVVAALPSAKKWKKLARQHVQQAGANGVDETRILELLRLLSGEVAEFPVVERVNCSYDGALPWLENAVAEHHRVPLKGIVTHREDRAEAVIVDGKDYHADGPAWELPAEAPVARNAQAFAAALGPMLRAARKLVLTDPHLNFRDRRWRDTVLALSNEAAQGGTQLEEILLIVGTDIGVLELQRQWRTEPWRDEPALPDALPRGATVKVRVIDQRPGGQKLHDRFVLTELGGARFTVGLDVGHPGETDGCHRLSAAHWREAWSDYVEGKGFDIVEEWGR